MADLKASTTMTVDTSGILTLAVLLVGFIVWLIRLEGRVNLADARYLDLKDDVTEIKKDVKTLVRNGHHDE